MSDSTESDLKDRAQQEAAGKGPQPGQIYRHYKGGLYTVVRRSVMEDTLVPLVTYHSNKKGTDWTRTLANFTEIVRVPASVMTADNGVSETPDGFYRESPRFTRVED